MGASPDASTPVPPDRAAPVVPAAAHPLAGRSAADLLAHFQLAIDAGRLGTWRWDKASGLVFWDEPMERLYGLAPGTFPGTYDAWLRMRGDDRDLATANATIDRAMATGDPYEIETRVVWPDGSVHWLLGRGKVTRDDDGEISGAIGVTVDITARKTVELEQRHIATTLQAALLPPDLPAIPGVDTATRYWPAGAGGDVGGDFYDLFSIGAERWAVVIGDVCGTGADAAAVTGITRHTIRAAARHGVDHAGVLEWLNDAVLHSGRDRFCTALYATLAPAGGGRWTLTAIMGGHPPGIVVRADATVESLGSPGTLIGVFPTLRSRAETIELGSGDTVVLYTDGVTDLPPPDGLSPAAVEAVVRGAVVDNDTADSVAKAIGAALDAVRPLTRRIDDVALVVLRVD